MPDPAWDYWRGRVLFGLGRPEVSEPNVLELDLHGRALVELHGEEPLGCPRRVIVLQGAHQGVVDADLNDVPDRADVIAIPFTGWREGEELLCVSGVPSDLFLVARCEARALAAPHHHAAAVLLGLAVFSKLLPAILIAPPVIHLWRQRRFRHGVAVGFLAAGVAVTAFGLNAVITGELNYQSGLDRKYVIGEYPFEPGVDWDDLRGRQATSGTFVVVEDRFSLLPRNIGYFLLGRHFGFIPFFFPGMVAVVLLLRARGEAREWQWVTLGTAVCVAVFLVAYMPYTWSGGGGPSGNRYYLLVYPLFLFLTPSLTGFVPVIVAWVGGWLCVGQILLNPFVSAKQPYLAPERGLLRLLPVELTMVRDLPIALDQPRARVEHGENPTLLLSLLDRNASLPEGQGFWIYGNRRADIIVRGPVEFETITVTAFSPIATEVSIEIGGGAGRISLEPGVSGSVTIRPDGVYSQRQGWAYLLQVTTSDGFVPRLTTEPGSTDNRFLGASISLAAIPVEER